MEVSYVEIKGYFDGHRYSDNKSRKYSNMLCKIEEFIDVNTIKLFYPKNLFVDHKELEAYVVFEDKLLRGRILEDTNIEITTLKFKNLIDFKCECTCNPEGFHRLTMKFENDETVVLDSVEDTNTSWSHKFENQIKEVSKLLIKSY